MSQHNADETVASGLAGTTAAKPDMTQADIDFLRACLNNLIEGSVSVDTQKVADELNYTNPNSVRNRISVFRKKFDIPLSGVTGVKTDGADKPAATPKKPRTPKVPKTPNEKKAKVTKAKTPTKGRKDAKAKSEVDGEEKVAEEDDATMIGTGQDELAVKADEAAVENYESF